MADFPTTIFTPRTVANLPGIAYDALDTHTFFAEDYELPADEIVAIETILGTNPEGAEATVSARIEALENHPQGGMAQPWFLS